MKQQTPIKNKIVIVDENDNVIGEASKKEALENGLRRRIVRIFLIDGNKIFLQKRGPNVIPFPNRWDQSAGGHVDAGGETYLEAARRELFEELGLNNIELKEIGKYYFESIYDGLSLPARVFNMVYVCRYSGEQMKYELAEVKDGRWFSVEEVTNLIETSPDKVTMGLKLTWNGFSKNILKYIKDKEC